MSRKRKRESKAARWKRQQGWKRLSRDVGATHDNANRTRIDLDPLEFTLVFSVQGGLDVIGPGTIKATDRNGRSPSAPVVDPISAIAYGPVAEWSQSWKDAEAIIEIRARLRSKRLQNRTDRFDQAVESGKVGWYRQDGDVDQRSVLLGSNRGADPSQQSDGLITTYRTEEGKYAIAREFWDGGYTEPDEYGDRQRANVSRDRLPIDFATAREAQEAFFHAVDMGESLNFESGTTLDFGEIRSSHRVAKMAERLSQWERKVTHENGDTEMVDMKKVYGRPRPQSKAAIEGKKVIVGAA